MSRINILIGENSSGKSSVLKFLLALKQTIGTSNESNLLLSGDFVNLGNYKEVIHYNKINKKLSFEFGFKDDYFSFFSSFFNGEHHVDEDNKLFKKLKGTLTTVKFEINKNLDHHKSIRTVFFNKKLGKLVIEILEEPDEINRSLVGIPPKVRLTYNRKGHADPLVFENVGYEKNGFLTLIKSEVERKILNKNVFEEIAFLLITQNFLEFNLKKIKYLNPINTNPQRLYYQSDQKRRVNTITSLEDVVIALSNPKNKFTIEKFSKLLNSYGLASDINVKKAAEVPVMELQVKISDLLSNILDVGYGVSLQLPILFECMISETLGGRTLLIEQPEIHLHPRLQAKFIETLVSMGNKNNYVIETHSEHIIRMLQVLVKQRKIKPEEISIFYLTREKAITSLSPHQIKSDGSLFPSFPSGFFDASYSLTKKLIF